MPRLNQDIIQFLRSQGFVVVSTIDSSNTIHNSCKGIVEVKPAGKIYLLDLYLGRTFSNLNLNPRISLTAVDENSFKGYCLKGKARIIKKEKLSASIIKAWEEKINSRITQRIIRSIHGEKRLIRHPEALLPFPEYLIAMETQEIIDLTPQHITH